VGIVRAALPFLLLAACDPKTLTYEAADAPLSKVAAVVNARLDVRLELAAGAGDRKVTVRFEGATAPQVLRKLRDVTRLPLQRLGEGRYRLGRDWRAELRERLAKTTLSLDARDRDVRDVLATLTRITREASPAPDTWIDFVYDPARKAGPGLAVEADRVSIEQFLDLLAEREDLAWDVRYGVVFVAPPARMQALPRASPDLALPDRRIELPFEKTRVDQALRYFTAASGVPVTVAPGAKDAVAAEWVTVQAARARLPDALALMLFPAGLTAELVEGEVRVRTAVKRFTYAASEVPLSKVAEIVNARLDVRLELGEGAGDTRVTVRFEGATAPQVLRKLRDVTRLPLQRLGEGRYRLGRDWRAELRARLKEKKVTMAIRGRDLGEALRFLRTVSGANFVLDAAAPRAKIEIQTGAITVEQALNLMTEANGLAWDLRWGVVFVSTPKRLKALPRDPPLGGLGGRRISLPFERTPLPKALGYLNAASGLAVSVDVAAKDDVEATEVTVQVSDTEPADALALMLLPAGFTAERKDGRIVVRKLEE